MLLFIQTQATFFFDRLINTTIKQQQEIDAEQIKNIIINEIKTDDCLVA